MGVGPARLNAGTLALALALVGAGAVGARGAGNAATHARESGARRAAAGSVRAFGAAVDGLDRSVDALGLLAPAIAAAPATPPLTLTSVLTPDGLSGVVLVPATGTPVRVAGTLPQAVTPARLATTMRAAFDISRDTGDPHAQPVPPGFAIALPVYRGNPISTQERRAAVTAWVVGVVDATAFTGRVSAPSDAAVLRVGGVAVTADAARGAQAAETTINLAGQPLQYVVTPNVEGGASAISLLVLLVGLAGAACVVLVGVRGSRDLARSTAETQALEREARTVAELGPLLQQSLDLAEVLPAVAVRLSDEFGLDSFAVELLGEHGSLVDVFAIGRRRSEGEPAVVTQTEGIPGGAEVAVPLLRGGRTIGRIRLVARDDLSPTQADGLRGAADLIAVATYNVELYEREQATVRRLQEVDKLKDAFLGTISHELRTPITAISGFVRLLTDRWEQLGDKEKFDFMHRVGRNTTSLGMLVDDLLDFARLERQALSTTVSPVPLDTVIANYVAQVQPALGDHPVDARLREGVLALADPRAFERILANLLTNAAKFSPAGSPIEVTLRAVEPYAVLSVSDRGPGIAEEDRLRIFTRFYRGESEAARSTRGAGIGLAVVHELVTQMNGDINVRGREPNGTTMEVRLPLADPSAPPPPRTPLKSRTPVRSTS